MKREQDLLFLERNKRRKEKTKKENKGDKEEKNFLIFFLQVLFSEKPSRWALPPLLCSSSGERKQSHRRVFFSVKGNRPFHQSQRKCWYFSLHCFRLWPRAFWLEKLQEKIFLPLPVVPGKSFEVWFLLMLQPGPCCERIKPRNLFSGPESEIFFKINFKGVCEWNWQHESCKLSRTSHFHYASMEGGWDIVKKTALPLFLLYFS